MELTLKQKLDFLWQDVLSFVKQGVKEGNYPKQIMDNFKELKPKDIDSIKNEGRDMPALRSPSDPILGKVLLTLSDVARLIDAGFEDLIEGDYKGFISMLKKYAEEQDPSVFNQVNANMIEMTGEHYMPYLSEKGKQMLCEGNEDLKCIAPSGMHSVPYYYDFLNKQIEWQEGKEFSFTGKIPTKDEIVEMILLAENERLMDIALLMVNVENLSKIGFGRFL
jgi:hypothetical protein